MVTMDFGKRQTIAASPAEPGDLPSGLAQARHRWQFTEASLFTLYSSQPGGPVHPIISVSDLTKTYASGFQALKEINLRIWPGEIFALLGPNGAGNDLDRHHMRDRQSDQRRCHGRRP